MTGDPVRAARRAHKAATQALEAQEEAVRNGDTGITATDLLEAGATVRLTELRVDAALSHVAAEVAAQGPSPLVRAALRQEARARQQDEHDRLQAQLRAIDSGLAAATAMDVASPGRDPFPTTREAFFAQHPDFREDAPSPAA